MPDIEVRYPESVYDFIVSDNKQEYNIQNVNPQNPPKITYKGIYYELKKISFSGSSNQPKVDNSGQLFLTHESKDRKSFIFIIRIKPASSNTEPSIDSFLKPPTINKIETTKLISNYIGNAFPVKTNAAETEFSCVIGHMRLTERDAINILKNYEYSKGVSAVGITDTHTIDSDDGAIRIEKTPTSRQTRICKRVATENNPLDETVSNEINDDIKKYKLINDLGISFIAVFMLVVFYMIYLYFFGGGLTWMGIPGKLPDTDFFNNPFPTMMGGGKKPRIRLGKKRV